MTSTKQKYINNRVTFAILLYFTTVFIWGSTWYPIKLQLNNIAPPTVSIFLRFALASALLFAYCFIRKLPMRYSFKDHIFMMLMGGLLFSTNYLLFYYACSYLTSGLSAIIFSLIVVLNAINARLFFKKNIDVMAYLGMVLGIIGLCLTFWPEFSQFNLSLAMNKGILLSIAGTFVVAFGSVVSVHNQRHKLPVLQTNAYSMFYGTFFLLVYCYYQNSHFIVDPSFSYLISLAYLSVFGSIVGFGCYLKLMGIVGMEKAAYATVLCPIIALWLSTLFENYMWTPRVFFAIALIILGNLLVVSVPFKRLIVPMLTTVKQKFT